MTGYRIYIVPQAFEAIKALPGNMRQRVRRTIAGFSTNPHPSGSKRLDLFEQERELWRFRLDSWRIIYAVSEEEQTIDILAVRKRPPYDYGDLTALLAQLDQQS